MYIQVGEARMIRAEEEEERQWEMQEMRAGWAAQEAEAVAKERARRARQQQLQADVEVFNRCSRCTFSHYCRHE